MSFYKELIRERLMLAADEIFAMFERTIASYEEELSRTREKERQRQHLEAVSQTQSVLRIEDVRQLMSCHEKLPPQSQKRTSTLEQVDPQPPYLKEEEEECWMTQGGEYLPEQEETDLTKFPLTCAFVNNDDHKDKAPESSQLHRSPSEETKARRLSSSSSPQHLTEADGGSRADNFFAPLSDHYCSEDEDMDEIQEPLSSNTDCEGDMRTQTDNTHSECSKKKTGKRCFACSVCAKRFTLRRNLTQHMQVHIDVALQKLLAMVTELTSEVRELRSEVRQSCRCCQSTGVIGHQKGLTNPVEVPIRNMEDLDHAEATLQTPEAYNAMVTRLSIVGGNNLDSKVRRIMSLVFTNEMASGLNWAGKKQKDERKQKRAFKETRFCKCIFDAVTQQLGMAMDDYAFAQAVQKWLRYAPDRTGGKARRDAQQLIGVQDEHPPQEGSSTLKQEEEEEEEEAEPLNLKRKRRNSESPRREIIF
ncbi:uncharacterized protein [Nerophis lumbriciformis]|uniref:uncharacterized protein isoform X1 n=1 Tax=Nerophis lumbriciformis TaxID=546530 RepID=UPI002ADF6CD2|nr:uncharacterized protein LOC133578183 isoform X1 [Nerophis lumbriciformis]